MRTILTSIVSAIRTILLTFAIANFFVVPASAQGQTNTPEMNPELAEIFSNAPPPPRDFATRMDYLKSFTNQKDILDVFHKGLINEGECEIALAALGDRASMDIYGKVVDQNSKPVAGAKVRGSVNVSGDFIEHYTNTDVEGRFSFLRLHGQRLYILPQKEGFEYDSNLPSERPKNYVPDPNKPLVFTMWKLRGAEPMVHSQLHAYIPCDGSATLFDLMTGKKSTNGDFTVKLTRNPLNIDRRKPFDWSVTFELTNGGFQEITNLAYPNEAPAGGYQSKMTFDFQANSTNWTSLLTPSLYFKSKDGQIYGRMAFKIMADFQPPPTLFDINIYANPGGSRNLEFDPNKQIRFAR